MDNTLSEVMKVITTVRAKQAQPAPSNELYVPISKPVVETPLEMQVESQTPLPLSSSDATFEVLAELQESTGE